MSKREDMIKIGALVVLGIIVRLVLLPYQGYPPDTLSFTTWSEALVREGLPGIYRAEVPANVILPNYPPVFLMLLWFLGKLAGPLGSIAVKLPALIFDLVAGLLVWHFLRNEQSKIRFVGTAAILLNPAIFLISAYWGQIDVLHTLLALLALVCAAQKRFVFAAVLITASIFTKIQAVIFLPLLVALASVFRVRLIPPVLALIGTALALSLPWLASGRIADLFHPFLGIARSYPYLTVNAMNLWWPISRGALLPDTTRFLGIPALYIGILLLVAAVAFAIVFLQGHHAMPDIAFAAAFVALAFFFLATDIHERYLYPLFLFLPFALGTYGWRAWAILGVLTISFLANIFYVLQTDALVAPPFLNPWWIINGFAFLGMVIVIRKRVHALVP